MKKTKIFFIFIISLSVFIYFFFKPITMHFLSEHFSKKLHRKVELTSLNLWPLQLDGLVTLKYYTKEKIKVHAEYVGEFTTKREKLGPVVFTSTSMGGLITISYLKKVYDITVENVDFKKFAMALGDNKIINSGVVNGTIRYHKSHKTGYTNLRIRNATINTADIEKDVTRVNDALQFDIFNLVSNKINDKNQRLTQIDKAQFNIELKGKTLYTRDVALRNEDYRIVLTGNAHQRGEINTMKVHLIDKRGCAMVSQTIEGTIQDPRITDTDTKVVKVVRSSPSSFFGFTKRFIDYGRKYAPKQQFFSQNDFKISSDIMESGDYIYHYASKNVLPKDCRVIYNGMIDHPKKTLNVKGMKF